MNERAVSTDLVRAVPLLRTDQELISAARQLVAAHLPALPVVDPAGSYAGIFGEREFIGAIFPAYLAELSSAAFVPRTLDEALEQRSECAREPVSRHMNIEHVQAEPGCSDAQLAETFLHHRVSIVPIVDSGAVRGVVPRSEFLNALADRLPH
jgi:CBS-domain-containing membrane protein